MSVDRRHVGKRLCEMVIHNGAVYLAGIVAEDPVPEDPAAQTKNILDQIDRLLAEAGTDKTKILTATIWLSDIRFYDALNSVWDAWVPAGNTPARACVEAKLAFPKFKVEIRVIAAL